MNFMSCKKFYFHCLANVEFKSHTKVLNGSEIRYDSKIRKVNRGRPTASVFLLVFN